MPSREQARGTTGRRGRSAASIAVAASIAAAVAGLVAGVRGGPAQAPGSPPTADGPYATSPPDAQDAIINYFLRVTNVEESSPEALLQAYTDQHTAGKYIGAVEMARRLIDAVPERPVGYYNLACSEARLHRYDDAIEALALAIDHGWRNLEHTLVDPDLDPIRHQRGFTELVAKIRRLRQAERIIETELRIDGWPDIVDDLRLQTPALLGRFHVPGVTIALVQDGQLVWTGAFGQADAHERTPMQVDHGFRLGVPAHLFALIAGLRQEATGGFTVAGVFQQAEAFDREHRVRLADAYDARPRVYVIGASRPGDSNRRASARTAAYTDRTQPRMPEGWPSYRPQNTNFVLLMSAVEATSGETFINYCRNRLFSPLLMDDTDFLRDDDPGRKPAVGHTVLGTPIESTVDGQWRTPAVYTTAPDMGRLIEALTSGAAMDESPDRAAGGPASFASVDESLRSMASVLERLGYGVQVSQSKAGPCIDVADCRGGMGCLVRWYPKSGRGVAIMFNAETGPDAALRIAHLALGGK